MLGLNVNIYFNRSEEKEYKRHRSKAATFDLEDMSVPLPELSLPADEGMPEMETDDDEPSPSANMEAIIQSLDVTPLRILPPTTQPSEPQGTPGGYTGSCAGATQDVAPARISGMETFGTPGGAQLQCLRGPLRCRRWRH